MTLQITPAAQPAEQGHRGPFYGSAQTLSRISMSLPETLLTSFDRFVVRRGFPSRSHTIAVILSKYLAQHKDVAADEIAVGTITLLHGELHDVANQLRLICGRYPSEIKTRTSVALAQGQVLEVLLIQGVRRRLRSLEQELERLRGLCFAKGSLFAGEPQLATDTVANVDDSPAHRLEPP